MDIRQLNLVAFGPFTDRELTFDQEASGLHIVYGPNEAGKSAALRGLKALLYGIDERTPDNFLHANDKLRIEGCVRIADGRELIFARRKGRKNTILSKEGESLDEQVLGPFLQGITREIFEMLFGIGHRALVQGGQEILEQKGEVGQALFSASIGSHALHAVLAKLDKEADELFRPRGSTQIINTDLKAYTDLKKEIREGALSSRDWEDRRRALTQTTKELEQIQSKLTDCRTEVNRLKRIQRVLPKLARRSDLRHKLDALGDVIVLSDDFRQHRQNTITERETAQTFLQKTTPRLNALQGQFEKLSVRQEVLEQNESIEALHARLGSHRKAMQDRPYLEAEYKQLRTDAESLLKDMRPDLALTDSEVFRPVFAKRQRITELGTQHPVLVAQVKQVTSNLRTTEVRLQEVRKESQALPSMGSPDFLRRAIAAARKTGDLDHATQSARSQLAISQERCVADLARLTLWTGLLDALPGLPLPNRENIDRFEERYAELTKRTHRLQEKQEETTEALRVATQRLDEIQRAGAIPTEEELTKVRTEREQAWQLLRRQWIDGEDVKTEANAIDAEHSLPDAFEHRVMGADKLADRLRREAERVHMQASLLAELENNTRHAAEIEKQIGQCEEEKKQVDTDWKESWALCEIQPHTPREMRAWLDNVEKLRDRIVELNIQRQQIKDLEHTRTTEIQALIQQLKDLGKDSPDTASLEAVLLESEKIIDELEGINRQRETLEKEIKTLGQSQKSAHAECQTANNELDEWNRQWKEVIKNVDLESDVLPSEAAEMIEKLRELFAKKNDMEKLQIRIQAIDEDAESFKSQVGNMAANVAPEFVNLSAEEAVVRLNTMLSESRTNQSRRQQIQEQLQQAQQDIKDSETSIQAMTKQLDALCVEAQCDAHTDLEEAERRSADHRQKKEELANIEQEILDSGEGSTLPKLETETEGADQDALPGKIQSLSNTIEEELEPRRTALAESKGREEKELELMDGSDQVAALADKGQSVLASIRSHAERYVRVKLAARILRDEIERFRKENQDPLIKRASEHFAMLTGGSFEELKTDYNEKDEPVLVGIRPKAHSSIQKVNVEGMSSGTRDQLYLALRLSSLEKYMESSEPMPFIVDDILVDFDDNRSAAALNALGQLSRKTQVILFTHHSRVVEQGRTLKSTSSVQIHEL
ncbi:MAG: AAA family ATPase [Ignavibacteria bacterium]|nr:AAA family ATPase [Ignavibacteria bacterium]